MKGQIVPIKVSHVLSSMELYWPRGVGKDGTSLQLHPERVHMLLHKLGERITLLLYN